MSGGKTADFHLAVKRRPREWDQGEHLLYAQHRPNLSSSRMLFTFVFVDHSSTATRAQVTLRPDEVHVLAFSPIEKMSDAWIIPSIIAQARPKWNGGYKLIVRLGATANKKERGCPRFLIVEFFGVRGDARSPL